MFAHRKTRLSLSGRAGMVYSSAGRTMKIDSEMLAHGEYDMVVYERSMRTWQAPHENEPICEEELSTIKKDIERHLRGCRIEWQEQS